MVRKAEQKTILPLLHYLLCARVGGGHVSDCVFSRSGGADFAKEEMRLSIERMLAQEQISSTEETNLTAFRIEDCTSKARALSVILNRDPGVESDIEILEETKESMGLDEIIITDGDGKITASTDATTGNDIGNDIRFQEFIQGLKDKSFSACKKDSTNENSYISAVSRLDSDGLVITKTSYFSQGSDEDYLYEGSERLTGLLDPETESVHCFLKAAATRCIFRAFTALKVCRLRVNSSFSGQGSADRAFLFTTQARTATTRFHQSRQKAYTARETQF